MLKIVFFWVEVGEVDGFLEVGHEKLYYTPYIKSCFSKILHEILLGEQFKVGPFFLKHPVKNAFLSRNLAKIASKCAFF